MAHKYVVFLWETVSEASLYSQKTLLNAVRCAHTWEIAYQTSGVLVAHKPSRASAPSVHLLADDQGVVLGSLYHRIRDIDAAPPVTNFSPIQSAQLMQFGARHLLHHYWGTYLAVIHDATSHSTRVLRDPTANMACYYVQLDGLRVFFSDIDSLAKYLPIPLSVRWPHLANRLLSGFVLSRECSLEQIEDVPGGEEVTLSKTTETRASLWHPAQFCTKDPIENECTAATELRAAVLTVVKTLRQEHENILLLLSGGLDSSVVASCLAQCVDASTVTCLNLYLTGSCSAINGPLNGSNIDRETREKLRRVLENADERQFARMVASKYRFKLIERERPVFRLDFGQICRGPFAPRPSAYTFLCDEDEIVSELASRIRATACFTGLAGDAVFFAAQSPIGAIDYIIAHPFGRRIITELLSASRLSGESVLTVAQKMLRHGYFHVPVPSKFSPTDRPHLLNDDVARAARVQRFAHPWLSSAIGLSPGKAAHATAVALGVPNYYNAYRREEVTPAVHPLASQPVVETCLRIPVYTLLSDGVSRGLARRAFRDLLPLAVSRRTHKGTGASFYRNVVTANIETIREVLLGGTLAERNLLDRTKLERYLVEDQPFLTVRPEQILDYFACESWLNQLKYRQTTSRQPSTAELIR